MKTRSATDLKGHIWESLGRASVSVRMELPKRALSLDMILGRTQGFSVWQSVSRRFFSCCFEALSGTADEAMLFLVEVWSFQGGVWGPPESLQSCDPVVVSVPASPQINMIQGIVAEINAQTGESECRYYKERLLYLEESQRDLLIERSRVLTCHGDLKNNRGAVSV